MYTIYTKPWCHFCEMAKALLKKHNLEFSEIELTDETKPQLLELVPNALSVPQIFKDGFHIGGFSDLKETFSAGE